MISNVGKLQFLARLVFNLQRRCLLRKYIIAITFMLEGTKILTAKNTQIKAKLGRPPDFRCRH